TSHNLMPDILSREGLKEALIHFLEHLQSHQLQINFHYYVLLPLPKEAEVFIYRITQELIQNVIKHAAASYVAVQVMLFKEILSITIEDNGKGFSADATHQ